MKMKSLTMLAASVALLGCQATAPSAPAPESAQPTNKAAAPASAPALAPAPAALPPVNVSKPAAPAVAAGSLPIRPVDYQQRRCEAPRFTANSYDRKGDYQLELHMQVELDGSVTQVRVSKSSGLIELDRAMLAMGKSCRFNPVHGAFLPAQVVQPLQYKLK